MGRRSDRCVYPGINNLLGDTEKMKDQATLLSSGSAFLLPGPENMF